MSVDVSAVLDLSGALQRATSLTDVVRAAQAAVVRTTRYRVVWLAALEETPEGPWIRILAIEGPTSEVIWETTPRFPVGADPFLLEVLEADHPVVIEDMATDPRTNKELVKRTDSHTNVSVPVRMGLASLGALCVGTFGDEGIVPPTEAELESLTVIAALMAATFDRVRLLGQRDALEAETKALAEKGRSLEEQLRHLQRLESVGQLAGGIAHDFNNLLTAIAGHAEIVLADTPEGPASDSLRVIVDATKRGAHLTHNLLSFSRKRVLTRRVRDLNEIVGRALSLVRPAIQPRIELAFSATTGEVPVLVDEVELEHAILNLVTNARDAIEAHGTISLGVAITELDDEFVARHEGKLVGTCARLSVSDDGAGIPPATLARVFEPFFSTKGVGRGTGLGLATVRSIVEQHGGVVTAGSEPGRGTTFAIYLPLATAKLSPRESEQAPSASGGGETILLAEDDDLVRDLLTRVLRGQGYRVLDASDGQTAIDLFRAESASIALVLTDLMMPRRTGLELVHAVLAFQQGTPIVVMSGYTSDPTGAGKLSELGIPVITKPTTPTTVLLAIRQALDRARGPS